MRRYLMILAIAAMLPGRLSSSGPEGFAGAWELVPQKSSVIPLYRTLAVDIQIEGRSLVLTQKWGTRVRDAFTDRVVLPLDGSMTAVPLQHQVAPTSVFLGIRNVAGGRREMSAALSPDGKVLTVRERVAVGTSQGASEFEATHTYTLSAPEQTIEYRVTRTTRQAGEAPMYTLKRAGSRQAYVMRLADDWAIDGGLPRQAFLISLQGLANSPGPNLYFVYPETWDFRYTPGLFDFLRDERLFSFRELRTPEEALKTFRDRVSGYVVWDKAVRTSLIVAFTVAGLERAVVVSEDMIPLVDKAGLRPVADLRGLFTGQTDAEIYRWAKDRYWSRCSKDYIVWLGGESGAIMKPGVADWGIHKRAFFNDLCANESVPEEYRLARELLADMKPFGFAFGWHSYAKDLEEEWVRLTSSYALRVEGLHTLPNLSFSSQVPATPGFQFRNNPHLVPGRSTEPGKKVYLACIQTDGIGLGAWTRPGRGELPYAWEVCLNFSWLAPVLLEYFYSQATPNDYFIGCLGGPGYVYPKAVPPRHLPKMVDLAYDMMKRLDLRVFEIMDYSEGVMVEGNSDLTREVVDAFYRGMPEAIGFVNGYVQSHTFAVRDKRPLVSYDYYLAPEVTEEQAAADIEELAEMNEARPYYLLMHVRQSSDIKRVKSILGRLSPEFEVVPLDVFLKMAGEQPTFKERYRDASSPVRAAK